MQSLSTIEFILLVLIACGALFIGRYSRSILSHLMSDEPSFEKLILNATPALLWVEVDGKVTWSNNAFDRLQKRAEVSLDISKFILEKKLTPDSQLIRADFQTRRPDRRLYFDIKMQVFQDRTLYIALSAKNAVIAEKDRARFVQTLSETFSHLPIGMAIFDKERDLSMFNPALSDLLDINSMWLTKRPSLRDFLDRLHHKGALPEPRNFKSWRDQILDMEKDAESGTYFDDWHMPNNTVIRVTGRPHPAGAVAFMFEDISLSVETERDYRTEIERLYSIMDTLKAGVVIFDGTGTLTFANDAFDTIWDTQLSTNLAPVSANELCETWLKNTEPSPVIGEIREFIFADKDRGNWCEVIRTTKKQTINVRALALTGGHTMIEFDTDTGSNFAQETRSKAG